MNPSRVDYLLIDNKRYKYLNHPNCPRKECLYASENIQSEGWKNILVALMLIAMHDQQPIMLMRRKFSHTISQLKFYKPAKKDSAFVSSGK